MSKNPLGLQKQTPPAGGATLEEIAQREAAEFAALEAEEKAALEAASAPRHVKMDRCKEQFPHGPHAADVHPEEVDNYIRGGWRRAQ